MHIWLITDNKPGHENQSLGLCAALQRTNPNVEITIHKLTAKSKLTSIFEWFIKRFPQGQHLPKPHFIIGAGHRTHPAILAAKRCYGGQSIVLMKPSFPTSFFSLCIIPEHDKVTANKHVLLTKGVINTINVRRQEKTNRTLILIGGPSKHAAWDDEKILQQIKKITSNTTKHYILSTSRRTPPSFVQSLRMLNCEDLEVFLADKTTSDWLPKQFSFCDEAWVSIDSVSMVYEALTSGVAVGILEIDTKINSRVIQGVQQLEAEKSVTLFSRWIAHKHLQLPQTTFNEAERCARWICKKMGNQETA